MPWRFTAAHGDERAEGLAPAGMHPCWNAHEKSHLKVAFSRCLPIGKQRQQLLLNTAQVGVSTIGVVEQALSFQTIGRCSKAQTRTHCSCLCTNSGLNLCL